MIGDGEIDLTEDLKFGRETNVVRPVDFVLQSSYRFPWHHVERITSDQGLTYGGTRYWGDTLSDEMGGVIRSTFNGGWFIGIAMKDRSDWFDKVFEEIRLELGLVQPGWVPCFRCGRLHLTSNPYSTCGKCDQEYKYKNCYNKLFGKYKYPDRYVAYNEYRTDLEGNIVHQEQFSSDYVPSY